MNFNLDTYGRFFVRNMPFFKERGLYFRAFGLEDVTEISDRLSACAAPVLIGVDAYECESINNGADAVNDTRSYAFILAAPLGRNHYTEKWREVMNDCYEQIRQIRNFLMCSRALRPYLVKDMQMTGYGPVGDNFYGEILNFRIRENQDFRPDELYFKDLKVLYDGTL